MRYNEAKKECARSKRCDHCAGAMETFFRPFLKAKPFKFGIVKPNEVREGYIAFNLPDPFNKSPEARRLADSLKSMTHLLSGQVDITVSALSKNRQFIFPVNVTTFPDARQNPLAIMQYF
jgi:hypothetical protein